MEKKQDHEKTHFPAPLAPAADSEVDLAIGWGLQTTSPPPPFPWQLALLNRNEMEPYNPHT